MTKRYVPGMDREHAEKYADDGWATLSVNGWYLRALTCNDSGDTIALLRARHEVGPELHDKANAATSALRSNLRLIYAYAWNDPRSLDPEWPRYTIYIPKVAEWQTWYEMDLLPAWQRIERNNNERWMRLNWSWDNVDRFGG